MNPPLYRAKRIDGSKGLIEGCLIRVSHGSYIYPVMGINGPYTLSMAIVNQAQIDPSTLEIQTSSGEFKPIDKIRIE